MTSLQSHQDICRQFAVLLSYPTTESQTTAASCQELLQENRPESTLQLDEFIDFLQSTAPARIEEMFTSTFDLQPLCHPFVGYQLCGESQQRTMFLIKLQEIYRQHDYNSGSELPDHICQILRFIGITSDQSCRQTLIDDGLLPALEKIILAIENDDHPYKGLLKTLQSFLSGSHAEKGAHS